MGDSELEGAAMAKPKKSMKRGKGGGRGMKSSAKPMRAKTAGGKPAGKGSAGKGARGPTSSGPKRSWLDADSHKPLIEKYARSLKSFLAAMADGRIDDGELEAQEQRLTALMKEIEPQLNPALHGRVTELLCELTAYDLMQVLHTMQSSRPQTTFRG
jgi:hypothetical protein